MYYAEETIKGRPTEVRIFEGASDLAEVTEAMNPRNASIIELEKSYYREWIGRPDLRNMAAVRDALNGLWQKGIDTLDRMREELADCELPAPVNRRRRPRWSEESGDELDLDRLRSGQSYWRECVRQHHNGPTSLTLLVSVASPARLTPEQILWRGAAAIVLAELLEASGYSVELWAMQCTEGTYSDGADNLTAVQLKAAGEPLDPSSLVNVVSGWAYRSAWFAAKCESKRQALQSLGRPFEPSTEHLDHVTTDPTRRLVAGVFDKAAAVQLIRETIEAMAS